MNPTAEHAVAFASLFLRQRTHEHDVFGYCLSLAFLAAGE
jgi:hypothetical protein